MHEPIRPIGDKDVCAKCGEIAYKHWTREVDCTEFVPSPEPQNGIALPPLETRAEDWHRAHEIYDGKDVQGWTVQARVEVYARERQLLSCIQSLARIHALALDLERSTNAVLARAVIAGIVRLSGGAA